MRRCEIRRRWVNLFEKASEALRWSKQIDNLPFESELSLGNHCYFFFSQQKQPVFQHTDCWLTGNRICVRVVLFSTLFEPAGQVDVAIEHSFRKCGRRFNLSRDHITGSWHCSGFTAYAVKLGVVKWIRNVVSVCAQLDLPRRYRAPFLLGDTTIY